MVAVTEPETVVAARHAGRAGRGAGRGARTAARTSVTLRNVAVVPARARPRGRRPGARRGHLRHGLRRQLLRARRRRRRSGWRRPGARRRADRGGAGDHGRDQRGRPARASRTIRGIARLPPRRPARAGRATAPTRAPPPRSTRAGSTARRAGRARRRGWRSCTRAASWRWDTPSCNESVIGTRFTGRLVEETDGRRAAGGRAGDHRARVDHRDGPVPARSRATRSPPASPCERGRRRGRRRGDRRQRASRASWPCAACGVVLVDRGACRRARPGAARATCSPPTRTSGPSSS